MVMGDAGGYSGVAQKKNKPLMGGESNNSPTGGGNKPLMGEATNTPMEQNGFKPQTNAGQMAQGIAGAARGVGGAIKGFATGGIRGGIKSLIGGGLRSIVGGIKGAVESGKNMKKNGFRGELEQK